MAYAAAAWEQAMRRQEVMLKALSGEIHWFRAADILGMSPRTLRRWRQRYERYGYDGLLDHRRRTPSIRRVPCAEVARVVRLYREQYRGFNGRHFHQIARREHGVTLSYSYVKQALQTAGLLKKGRASASCCTWTAACIRGWRWCPSTGAASLRCRTMPPTACCTRRSIRARARTPS